MSYEEPVCWNKYSHKKKKFKMTKKKKNEKPKSDDNSEDNREVLPHCHFSEHFTN